MSPVWLAARASWLLPPTRSPHCAPGSHHLVPTTRGAYNRSDKGCSRGEHQEQSVGEEKKDEERKRMEERAGSKQTGSQNSFPPRSCPVLAKSFSCLLMNSNSLPPADPSEDGTFPRAGRREGGSSEKGLEIKFKRGKKNKGKKGKGKKKSRRSLRVLFKSHFASPP